MVARWVLGVLYTAAGILHITVPHPFIAIVPPWVPMAGQVVLLTGVAELAGATGLLQPFSAHLRRLAGWSLAAYALCVWPANMHHMLIDMAKPDHGLGLAYHIPRLMAQPLIMWWALWASGAINWPWRKVSPKPEMTP